MKPSTTVRASSARSAMRARSAGSSSAAGAVGTSERRARDGHRAAQLRDELLGADLLGLRLEVEQHAVPEDGEGQRANVVEAHVGAALEQGAGLRTEDERLRRTDAGAVRHPLADEVGRA